jgi:hypothetical protein
LTDRQIDGQMGLVEDERMKAKYGEGCR